MSVNVKTPSERWEDNRPHLEDREIYGNWEVYHPDGSLMFRCDNKKANWYLKRDLAINFEENKIKLTFTPEGKGHVDEPFYLTKKANICVVCGKSRYLTRHHVIPYCFRRHIPEEMKSKDSHDIVLLCIPCHRIYETHAWNIKKELAEKHGMLLAQPVEEHSEEEKLKFKAVSAAYAIIEHGHRIPEPRKEILLGIISSYLGKETVEDSDLEKLVEVKFGVKNLDFSLGKSIVDKIDDLDSFIKMWRAHFVETMKPEYLPELWSIDHKREKR